MEGGGETTSFGLMPQRDEIVIPILAAAQGSSSTGLQGGNSKYSTASESGAYPVSNAVQNKALTGKSTNSEALRRRPSSKITESESTLGELPVRIPSMKKSQYSQTKSRVMEVELYDPTSSIEAFQGSQLSSTSSEDRNALSQKIKSMRAGTLVLAEGKDDDDCDSSDDNDDDDDEEEEEEEKKIDEKNAKPQKCTKIGKKLKAIDVVIEWILFICAMVVLISSLYANDLKRCVIWGLEIWKWCVIVAVIFCGRLVTKWAKDCIVFLIESKYLFNEKVVYFLHGVKQSVRVVIWLALVLLAWVLLIDRGVKRSKETIKVLNYITKALVSCLIGAVMWMVKTLLVKLIAASFHVKTFFSKIREAISDEYVLWILSVPPLANSKENGGNAQLNSQFFCLKLPKWLMNHRPKKEGSEVENQQKVVQEKTSPLHKKAKVVQEKTSRLHKKEEITLKKLGKMKPGKMPASTMGQLIDRIRSSKLSIVSSVVNESLDDGREKDINSRLEAEQAASPIFENVQKVNNCYREYIQKGDLSSFRNKDNEDCLDEWFDKVAEEGKITKQALTEWAVNIFKQREYLSHSLKDAKTAIEELNRILSGIVLILIVVVWVLLMGFATTNVLLLLSSQVLLAGFIFRNACRTLFEAMIFVFLMHPFDVGDRCVIDGVQMIVEEVDILKTAFLRYDNEMIYYPNAVLATKPISNYNRSPDKMGDCVNFDVDVSTSTARIEDLKDKIKEYIDGNPHHWHPDHSLQIKEIEDMNKMKMVLFVNHKVNFQDFLQKMNRKTELMMALKEIFEEIGIKYHLLPQELHISHIGSAVPATASVALPVL